MRPCLKKKPISIKFLKLSLFNKDYYYLYQAIGQMRRVFANGPGNWGLIPGRVIPKTQKMVLDVALLSTQHYKVRIKGKVEQSRERSSASLHIGVVASEKGAFGSPLTKVANFTLLIIISYLKPYNCVQTNKYY